MRIPRQAAIDALKAKRDLLIRNYHHDEIARLRKTIRQDRKALRANTKRLNTLLHKKPPTPPWTAATHTRAIALLELSTDKYVNTKTASLDSLLI